MINSWIIRDNLCLDKTRITINFPQIFHELLLM